jgi:O-antigen/teichoic acid export membrane protein
MRQRRSTGSSPGDEARPGLSSPDDRESIVASSGYALLAQLATVVFTAILTLYLVRALGPSEYGIFALAIGVGSLVALPADFGISSSTARFVAEHRGDAPRLAAILADAVRLKLIASSVACGALAALAAPIAAAYHAPLAWPLRLVAIAVLGQNFMFLFEGAFVAAGRVATTVRMVLGESAVECSTSILLVLLGGGAAAASAGRAIGYCSGGLLALALGARSFGWPAWFRRRGRPSSVGRIARYAVPLMLVDGANALFSMIDLLLIGAYLGSRQVGLFGAPLRMLTLLTYPGSAVASGVAPRLARAGGQEPDGAALAGGLRGLILLQSLMLAPLIVWAQPIVHLLLGAGYGGSVDTVRVMSLSVYLGGLAPLVSLSANYLGDAASRIPLMISAAVIDGVIDVVLIPRIGIISGAIATAVAYAVMVGGHLLICRRHVVLPFLRLGMSVGRGLIAAGAMAAALAAIGSDPSVPILVIGTLAGSIVFGLALVAVGEISRRELAQARVWAGARISALRP